VSHPDILIVGGGVIGSACAYYMAKSGLKVRLCEARGLISSGIASQASAGGVRQQGREAPEIPLAMHSIGIWAGLEQELEADLHYRRRGMTVCVHKPEALKRLHLRIEAEQALGLDIRLVEGRELAELVPGLSPQIIAGSYCPTDGQADPIRTTMAFANAAQRLGAEILPNTPVHSLVCAKDRVSGVICDKGEMQAGQVVLASGAWSRKLAAGAGLELPFKPVGLQMMVTAKRPPQLEQVLSWVGQGLSLKQSPDGGFVIGGGWPGDVDASTYRADPIPGAMAKSARAATGIFPALNKVPVVRAWLGIEAFCEDHIPALGPVAGLDGLIMAAGFSAHGFALAPAVGSLLAKYLAKGEIDPLLKPFTPDRFSEARHES
jgi:sarcosine oxidase subunit beta